MKRKNKKKIYIEKDHGFQPDIFESEHYVLGSGNVAADFLQLDGQWDRFLPIPEIQNRNGLETMNCTVYGTLNAIETLMLRKYGIRPDYSERFIGVLANTTTAGNSPHTVAETIRKCGVVDEVALPFGEINTWDGYYSPKPMSSTFLAKGKEWLKYYSFRHEWVFQTGTLAEKQRLIKEALRLSPVGVSVHAWIEQDGLYVDEGKPDNHWVILYGYVNGKYWKCFDHYDNTSKKLAWDYDFGFAKRYHLDEAEVVKSSWISSIIEAMREFFSFRFVMEK